MAWKIGGMNNSLTLAIFFEIANQTQPIAQGQRANIQFITYYQVCEGKKRGERERGKDLHSFSLLHVFFSPQHPNGQMRMRVITVSRNWADPAINLPTITAGFDQEVCGKKLGLAKDSCFH